MKVFKSKNTTISKYVFDNPVTESVLYQYQDRTVICCSVQSGCPVGCLFCGTGAAFIRSLTADEIVSQVEQVLATTQVSERFQIMFMSMGEPFLNYKEVREAIIRLSELDAELLVSTIAPRNMTALQDFISLSGLYPKIGLQFSIHKSTDAERDKLIPFSAKLTLREIRNYGVQWALETGRAPFLNYCVDKGNSTEADADRLMTLFPPSIFNFTFSVICQKDEAALTSPDVSIKEIKRFEALFSNAGYNTRVFNPEGQDDIGGGCGQLWYTQKKLRESRAKP